MNAGPRLVFAIVAVPSWLVKAEYALKLKQFPGTGNVFSPLKMFDAELEFLHEGSCLQALVSSRG